MKGKLFTPIFLLAPFIFLKAQDEIDVFEKVEVNAHTNQKAWNEHVRKKAQLPVSVSKDIPAGTYKVNVQFVIDKHGNIGQVKPKNDPGFGLAKKAVSVISSYKGTWQPANQCGRNVNTYKEHSVIFIIPTQ